MIAVRHLRVEDNQVRRRSYYCQLPSSTEKKNQFCSSLEAGMVSSHIMVLYYSWSCSCCIVDSPETATGDQYRRVPNAESILELSVNINTSIN